MYTMLGQVTELNLVVVASSYRKIAPGVRKVVLIGGWYEWKLLASFRVIKRGYVGY